MGRRTAEVAELYAGPPSEFVRRRDALAGRLREQGRAEEAAEVRRLRKPTAVVWAINRLAHETPAKIRAFLDATGRVRRAQAGGHGDLDEASAAQRRALRTLVSEAASGLGGAPGPVPAAIIRRIETTLLAAAADTRLHEALREGRLTEELESPGFDALAGV
ncbi:MAG TPA: hypothetical protein VNN07_00615, partial [Candidatus Tectomicrobia bacterium]|nr:hypothetical protein [Candidatus Tectomicrobia bacterium]